MLDAPHSRERRIGLRNSLELRRLRSENERLKKALEQSNAMLQKIAGVKIEEPVNERRHLHPGRDR